MLESFSGNRGFEYKKLTEEEKESRGILGRLVGVMADTKNPTRNGRLYKKELWEKVFSNPIMIEKIDNRCVLGELGHPEGRLETDIEKVAICLAEVPKINGNGELCGVFDILNTPNGNLLKNLCDYGVNIGVSSRGEGDVFPDENGNESVDPDTYTCECLDAVLLPAVKGARPAYVTESVSGKKTLKQVLKESINSAKDKDRKIMEDTLKSLDIDLEEEDNRRETDVYIGDHKNDDAVDNNEARSLSDLQEALARSNDLEHDKLVLSEKLSVCYAKENELKEKFVSVKKSVLKLTEKLKRSEASVTSMQKALSELKETLSVLKKDNLSKDRQIVSLNEKLSETNRMKRQLSESVSKDAEELGSLRESFSDAKKSFSAERKKLSEELAASKKDNELLRENYSKKLEKSKQLVEKYKGIANTAIDKYIDSQANMYGISVKDIRNKLGESYTFDDIERVCSDLREYKINMNKLPFNLSRTLNESSKIKVNQIEKKKVSENSDDELDPQLLALSGL